MRNRSLLLLGLLAAAAAVAWTASLVARRVERRVAAALRRAGVSAREVRFAWFGPLQLLGVAADVPGVGRLTIEAVDLRWRIRGGPEEQSHVHGVDLRGARLERAPLAAFWPAAAFDVVSWTREGGVEGVRLRQRSGGGEIEAVRPPPGAEAVMRLENLDLGGASVSWGGETILDPGRLSGRVTLATSGGRLESRGTVHGDAVRLAPPTAFRPRHPRAAAPTAMDVEWTLRREGRDLEVDPFTFRLRGLEFTGRGVLRSASGAHVDAELRARCDLAEAFRTAGLAPPLPEGRADTFGTASVEVSIRGPLENAADLKVAQRLRFEPTEAVVRSLSYLRGPFHHAPKASPGVVLDVREGAADFIPIAAVPSRFQRALLISEDAGFLNHGGIDLAEIVAAWSANEEGGRPARGASTITQQLVKNLLLSPERTYGRKLEEAALALMVDAVVPKARLLEIYVNIIEWGPRLHGLVPAARHYFGKTPADLTAKEAAFLVCLIPNPVRYHEAHVQGRAGPGMEQLMHTLLGKLRARGDLGEDEYQEALTEELRFVPE